MEQNNLENGKYWETLPREMIEGIIKGNIRTLDRKMTEMTEIFCSAGYYLKRQQNEEQWKETGASNFAEYVKATYGKSRGWATRMIQINDRYSIGGNDPRLDAKYQSFSVSQLQEMLYLTEDEAAGVTPDMTVRQIRQQRPAPEPVPDPAQNEQYFAQEEQKTAQEEQKTALDEQKTAQEEQNVSQGQQAEVIDLSDFCDVATDPEPEPEPEPVEDTAAAEGITIDLTDLADPEDVPKVVREPVMADWSQQMEMPEGAAAGTYTRFDVYVFELEARRDLEQLREVNRLSAEEGGPQLPERTMKKHIMRADAAKLLLRMMDMIYANNKDQEDDE